MRRYRRLIISILLIFIFGFIFIIYLDDNTLHDKININDVEDIIVWGNNSRTEVASDKEQNIIDWFNKATEIRQNKNFAGTTSTSGIHIRLKDGKSIHILNSGTDFEVQRTNRSGKLIAYWGKQADLRKLLNSI